MDIDVRRRVRTMAKEISPKLVGRSRTEFCWIWGAAVTRLCDELDQVWRAKIAATPTVAARRLTVVRPSDTPSGGTDGSDDRCPPA